MDMMNRLCELACAECHKCAMGLEPERVDGYWRHGHDLCLSPGTHDRMDAVERAWEKRAGTLRVLENLKATNDD